MVTLASGQTLQQINNSGEYVHDKVFKGKKSETNTSTEMIVFIVQNMCYLCWVVHTTRLLYSSTISEGPTGKRHPNRLPDKCTQKHGKFKPHKKYKTYQCAKMLARILWILG